MSHQCRATISRSVSAASALPVPRDQPRANAAAPPGAEARRAGAAGYFGGAEALAELLITEVEAHAGVECQVGIADGLFAATLAARPTPPVAVRGSERWAGNTAPTSCGQIGDGRRRVVARVLGEPGQAPRWQHSGRRRLPGPAPAVNRRGGWRPPCRHGPPAPDRRGTCEPGMSSGHGSRQCRAPRLPRDEEAKPAGKPLPRPRRTR
ncbi:hypothetical protein DMA12_18350 [Amycolatopsis balhimycina DSM 5908]|uniref:Uncharacterized protein n=1 Tax=Amycolatopsis balhimycina DSM 5908 TaxID=1081091 RepID=A0A428WL63_AMYBA|nr:hypothetical protein DMA12_18350 [Amycolatopsis balhimycina DSM 5908]